MQKLHTGVILIRLAGYNTQDRGEAVCKVIVQHHNRLSNAFTVIQPAIVRIREKKQ